MNGGLLLQRNPDIGGVAAKGFTKKGWRGDADDGKRMSIQHKSGAHDRSVSAISGLPCMVAKHDDGCGSRLVVVLVEEASAKCAYAQRGEIISSYELRAQ